MWLTLRKISILLQHRNQKQMWINMAQWMYVKHRECVGTLRGQTEPIFFLPSVIHECTTLSCITVHNWTVSHCMFWTYISTFASRCFDFSLIETDKTAGKRSLSYPTAAVVWAVLFSEDLYVIRLPITIQLVHTSSKVAQFFHLHLDPDAN